MPAGYVLNSSHSIFPHGALFKVTSGVRLLLNAVMVMAMVAHFVSLVNLCMWMVLQLTSSSILFLFMKKKTEIWSMLITYLTMMRSPNQWANAIHPLPHFLGNFSQQMLRLVCTNVVLVTHN
jgi:hypothetical protein